MATDGKGCATRSVRPADGRAGSSGSRQRPPDAVRGFLFRLLPPRPDFAVTMSPDERATMNDHARYWAECMARGDVIAYGPVNDPSGPYGIGIIVTDDLAAAEG